MRSATSPSEIAGGAALFARPFGELVVGERFVTRGRTISEVDLLLFCALTGDWHPQHCDAAWAANSPFAGRIAHGMLLLSYAVGLVPFDPQRVVALRGIERAVFKRPVYPADTIHVEGEIERLRRVDEGSGLVAWRWALVNQDDDVVVRTGVEVVWRDDEEVG